MSIYVDDLQMSGLKSELAPMWKRIGKLLDLEPAVSSSDTVYLGCQQRDVPYSAELVREQEKFYEYLMQDR